MRNIDHSNPKDFKPLIDKVLLELTEINDHEKEKTQEILNELSGDRMISFWYLKQAAFKTKQWSYHGKVEEVLHDYGYWGKRIFIPASDLPFLVNIDDDYEDDLGADTWPVYLEEYPIEAHEALHQDFYLGGGNGDVLGVWKQGIVFKIFVATPNEFEIIAQDPIEWVEKTKSFVVKMLKRAS